MGLNGVMPRFPISLITAIIVCCTRSTAPGAEPSAAVAGQPGAEMAEAASRWLATLDETQRVKAALPFDGDARENWHFVPMERAGLPLDQMKAHQQALAMGLLSSALSNRGFLKATAIMSLEQVLAEIEKNPDHRNPGQVLLRNLRQARRPRGMGVAGRGAPSFDQSDTQGRPGAGGGSAVSRRKSGRGAGPARAVRSECWPTRRNLPAGWSRRWPPQDIRKWFSAIACRPIS